MGKVNLHLDGVVGRRVASSLDISLDAVGLALDRRPEDESLTRLCHQTCSLGVEVNVGLAGVSELGAGKSSEGLLGLECGSEDGVVHEVLSNGKVDPVILGGQGDAGGAVGDCSDLVRGADTAVDENSRRRKGTGGEDHGTVSLEVDDLAGAGSSLDFDAGDSAALSDNAENLGVELKLEVGKSLSEGEVVTDRSSTQTVVDLLQCQCSLLRMLCR